MIEFQDATFDVVCECPGCPDCSPVAYEPCGRYEFISNPTNDLEGWLIDDEIHHGEFYMDEGPEGYETVCPMCASHFCSECGGLADMHKDVWMWPKPGTEAHKQPCPVGDGYVTLVGVTPEVIAARQLLGGASDE